MKKIHQLILKSYLGPMILTFFIVMFVLLMNFVWRYIDELVGKGLAFDVILELMGYAAISVMPTGLPLATLLAAIMTMGNLGENNELLAMKSAGMSLMRIMQPLIIVVAIISVAGFFLSNNLVPYSMRQISALRYDINRQKQTLEFKDGLFFNGIENISIRVESQNPETQLLKGILIYDNRKDNGDMTTIVADSGYIRISDDRRHLLITLYNGESFDETRNTREWYNDNTLDRNYFELQDMAISLEGYAFDRSDASDFGSSSQSKNVAQLQHDIDSIQHVVDRSTLENYQPLFSSYIFPYDNTMYIDSLRADAAKLTPVVIMDSVNSLSVGGKQMVWSSAISYANNSRSHFTMEEGYSKDALNQLYRHQVDWHKKWAVPVSIMIFFLIGAPLGAIIRKGGLGMPIVVSVLFFVVYYIISVMGEKMAKEGTWDAMPGSWLSSLVLFPIAVFLIYKATNDSSLFNAERWIAIWQKIKAWIIKTLNIKKKENGVQKAA